MAQLLRGLCNALALIGVVLCPVSIGVYMQSGDLNLILTAILSGGAAVLGFLGLNFLGYREAKI
jgi:hypothetical protein